MEEPGMWILLQNEITKVGFEKGQKDEVKHDGFCCEGRACRRRERETTSLLSFLCQVLTDQYGSYSIFPGCF
ncbi:hypothetical protein PoB_003743100 [Plakobranchus ocellatus]|uniref:Uncharacterized protein n=1 Tax=Plakobranchus ocellatus TaxID=259542 RepID=A0AAV4ARZ7_9GAST|nr:hypothetical protein PoB_003743100 [Plakobranchus ocellatus]